MTDLPLAPILDTAAAPALQRDLLGRLDAHQPLRLAGADVAQVGQACLQLLAAARIEAAARGLAFQLTAPSPALVDMAKLARLDAVLLPLA